MATAAGYVLKIPADRRQELTDHMDEEGGFSEPVRDFQHSRNIPLVCLISFMKGAVTHIGYGRRGVRAGTGLRRLNVRDVIPLLRPIQHADIVEAVRPRVRKTASERFERGGLFPPKTFEAVIDAVVEISPDVAEHLKRFGRLRRERVEKLGQRRRRALAEQKEAVLTALDVAGLDRRPVQEWEAPAEGMPDSFLEGLPVVDLREDQMILNDLDEVPGFSRIRKDVTGIVQFEDERRKLKVVLANRTRLEEQMGVDLIYYNETYQSFVMVQYKAMESEPGGAIFRLPNSLLKKEIARMEATIRKISGCAAPTTPEGFRFSTNPIFLKFCPRLVFNPDNVGLTPGMYLGLEHWKLMEKDPALAGVRGGRGLRYENAGRYLQNRGFIELVRNAWVGTTPAQSALLAPLMEELVQGKRAVMLAVKSNKPTPLSMQTDEEDLDWDVEDDEDFDV